jgi:endonuclease-3
MQYAMRLEGQPDLALVRDRLLAVLGPQRDERRRAPLDQLVYGILSARTHDHVSDAAFRRLKRRYPSWRLLCTAHPRDIAPLVRAVTFAERKVHYLPAALRSIASKRGALDLHFLAHCSEETGMAWLRELAGVDAKVAATVLNFSTLRKRVLAVDTHLLRIGERLGLLPADPSYRTGYEIYMRLVPNEWDADTLYELHWLLKYHGQAVCTHARPACACCPLSDLCPSAKRKGGT